MCNVPESQSTRRGHLGKHKARSRTACANLPLRPVFQRSMMWVAEGGIKSASGATPMALGDPGTANNAQNGARFATTRWSLVLAAGRTSASPEAEGAPAV